MCVVCANIQIFVNALNENFIFISRNVDNNEWQSITTKIINTIFDVYNHFDDNMKKKMSKYVKSIVEQQFHFALGK